MATRKYSELREAILADPVRAERLRHATEVVDQLYEARRYIEEHGWHQDIHGHNDGAVCAWGGMVAGAQGHDAHIVGFDDNPEDAYVAVFDDNPEERL